MEVGSGDGRKENGWKDERGGRGGRFTQVPSFTRQAIAMKPAYLVAILWSLAIPTLGEPASEPSKARVTVLKCCQRQEVLVKESDSEADARTRCNGTKNNWKPVIYSPSKRGMLDHPPAEWDIVEGKRPVCDESSVLTYVPYRVTNPFVLMEDGHVLLDIHMIDSVGPDEYCADSNALLVCTKKKMEGNHAAATMRPRVRKCCGKDAAFYEEIHSCSDLKETANPTPLLPNASVAVEIVAGFPNCPHSDNLTILGDAKDSVLLPDGGMEIDGVTLPTSHFCVERIKELNQVSKVFACSEHASQRPIMQAADIRFTLYPVGFIISAVFLAATLAAGWLLPASHHVLHWRCQTHHVTCLMLGDLLMAIIQLAGDSLHGGSCKAIEANWRRIGGQGDSRGNKDLRATVVNHAKADDAERAISREINEGSSEGTEVASGTRTAVRFDPAGTAKFPPGSPVRLTDRPDCGLFVLSPDALFSRSSSTVHRTLPFLRFPPGPVYYLFPYQTPSVETRLFFAGTRPNVRDTRRKEKITPPGSHVAGQMSISGFAGLSRVSTETTKKMVITSRLSSEMLFSFARLRNRVAL
ncbi:putative G-protein coupled receptor Mth-like 1 [Lasioglossum baleicum]|uniref:putative G-protein coupled receptor Mth-like 1 n=1 Tax=Lasioglossum baleicum TaxID=434251 RepID=UPI003FCEDED7